jgi:DNA mismatch repair protein MutS2
MREQAETMLAQAQEAAPVADDEPLDEETTETTLADLDTQLTELETGQAPEAEPSAAPASKKKKARQAIEPGDQVFVHSFNTTGEVVEVQNKEVEVQLGRFRTSVPLADVELKEKASRKEKVAPAKIKIPAAESPGMELDLRGQIAEEALLELDKYLDQAFTAHLPWVRIIHGKGSGVLRQAVRQSLNSHAQVSSYRPGQSGEGGEGVTVAKLAIT